MTSASTLEIAGVTKTWPRRPAPVLDAVDLTVAEGTIVRVLGANGAGKTTLLRIAAGLIIPDAGTVSLAGSDPERDWRRYQRHVGFLTAGSTGLYARLSAIQHLEYWARLSMMKRTARKGAVSDAIEQFALAEFADRRVDRISLGQRQRVRLAMTFLHQPRLVLLDEPASSLDDSGVTVLVGALDDLRRRSGSAIWCTPAKGADGFAFDLDYRIADGVVAQA